MVVISCPSCMRARLRHESTRLPFTCTVHAPHWPWSQPFFVPVSTTVSRMQSSNVVRGSIFNLWSLPLIRSVIGTALSIAGALASPEYGPSEAFAGRGTYAAIKPAAAVVPVAERNWRREGSCGFDCCLFDMTIPLKRNNCFYDLGRGHNRIGIVRKIDFERGLHFFVRIIGDCISYHRDFISKLSGKANCRLDTCVGNETEDN